MMSPLVSPGESPTQQARNAGVPPPLLRESGQHEGSPDHLSRDDYSGTHHPAPIQQRLRHGRRDEDSPDLLPPNSSNRLPGQDRRGPEAARRGYRWVQVQLIGFCILTFNSGMAIYRSWGNGGDVSFVVCAYMNLVGLFFSIKKYQATPPNSRRKQLMVCVWIFTMLLAIGFVYQIISTTAKPTLHSALLLWAIPAGTGISVFIIFSDRSGAHLSEGELDV